jgi:branched-subunit amino acid aminotransferase/4-amino-4-deoxychorismate lyase
VPIRTAVDDRTTGMATFNVGAGITADSTAAEEWAECLAKARVVRPPAVPEHAVLCETLRLHDGRLMRRDAHVARMRDSAELFGWPADVERLHEVLTTLANVVVELDDARITPPIACGLLPGVFRQELLTRGEVRERVIRVDEPARATRLWLVNSLREWIDVELVAPL